MENHPKTRRRQKAPKPKVKSKHKVAQGMVVRLCEIPQSQYKDPRFWSREIKHSKDLIESLDDLRFWDGLTFNFKLNSLAWLKSEDGRKALVDKWNIFNYNPLQQEKPEILPEKVGESRLDKIPRRKLTLMEFVDG